MEKEFKNYTKQEIRKEMINQVCFKYKFCHKPCIFSSNNDEDLCPHVEELKRIIDAWVQIDREAMEDDCRDYPEWNNWDDEEESNSTEVEEDE